MIPRWVAGALLVLTAGLAAEERPNIILILADDLGYGELGSYGQPLIATPRLDQMAGEGMRFTQFYAGSTVCAPSRSVLITGQHTGHTTVRGNAGPDRPAAQTLRAGEPTVARTLREADYRTMLIGKWGLGLIDEPGEPRRQGFDSYFGFLSQTHAHNHFPDHLWRDGERVPLRNDLVPLGTASGAGYARQRLQYAGDLFAEEALQFIARQDEQQPFFLYLSVIVPHANNERTRALGDGHEVPDYGPYDGKPWPESAKAHAAMITRLDAQIGKLLDALRERGLAERTLVLFSSDNGPHDEGGPSYDPAFFEVCGPLTGLKRSLTEGGIRVPLLAWWPGRVPAGAVSPHVGYFGDFFATFAELAGAALPEERDSVSLVPTLVGQTDQRQHEFLYWEFYEDGFSQAVLLAGRWKGIRLHDPASPIRLYDLQADLAEQDDIAAQQPERVQQIAGIMTSQHQPNEHWRMPAIAPAHVTKVERTH